MQDSWKSSPAGRGTKVGGYEGSSSPSTAVDESSNPPRWDGSPRVPATGRHFKVVSVQPKSCPAGAEHVKPLQSPQGNLIGRIELDQLFDHLDGFVQSLPWHNRLRTAADERELQRVDRYDSGNLPASDDCEDRWAQACRVRRVY